MQPTRREFLHDVSSGMLVAGLGASLADDLGISAAFAGNESTGFDFGRLQPLVAQMQETPADKLQPILIKQLQSGDTKLRDLVAAAALANAVTFGGQDYVGFHVEMALLPSLQIADELRGPRKALPVLKVLFRNAERIQGSGLCKKPNMKPVEPLAKLPSGSGGRALREATRAAEMEPAERLFAAQVNKSTPEAFNSLLWSIQDNANVHRFCLAYRSWAMIDLVGQEYAHTLLRQCVRYCVDSEQNLIKRKVADRPVRKLIPRMMQQYKLLDFRPGTRKPDDEWLDKMTTLIYSNDGVRSMDAVAAALAEGISPEFLGQAVSLAANQVVLRLDKHRDGSWRAHGATSGVHAADAANAWRNMIRFSNPRNVVAGLLMSAYHSGVAKNFSNVEPYPLPEHREAIKTNDPKCLLAEAEAAIRANDQGRAAAAIQVYSEGKHAPEPVFVLMRRFAISEDGRLHAEKYYRTVREEFGTTRKAFRWRQLVSLARVTASAYGFTPDDKPGFRAAGYEAACRQLGVDV